MVGFLRYAGWSPVCGFSGCTASSNQSIKLEVVNIDPTVVRNTGGKLAAGVATVADGLEGKCVRCPEHLSEAVTRVRRPTGHAGIGKLHGQCAARRCHGQVPALVDARVGLRVVRAVDIEAHGAGLIDRIINRMPVKAVKSLGASTSGMR